MPESNATATVELMFDHHIYFEGMTDLLEHVNELPQIEGILRFDDYVAQDNEFFGRKYVIQVHRIIGDIQLSPPVSQSWFNTGMRCNFDGDPNVITEAQLFADLARAYFVRDPARRSRMWLHHH